MYGEIRLFAFFNLNSMKLYDDCSRQCNWDIFNGIFDDFFITWDDFTLRLHWKASKGWNFECQFVRSLLILSATDVGSKSSKNFIEKGRKNPWKTAKLPDHIVQVFSIFQILSRNLTYEIHIKITTLCGHQKFISSHN